MGPTLPCLSSDGLGERTCERIDRDVVSSALPRFPFGTRRGLFGFLLPVASHRPPRTRSSVGKFWIVEVAMGEKEKGEAVEVNPVTGSPFSRRYHKLLERRMKLPVWGQRSKFLDALAKRQVVVVAAPPGSGKSTQIPQFVIEAGYASKGKQIACTQPRRMVATALSRRVAQEMDVKLGEEVGYSVLFEDCTDRQTILK
ncbi:hypothetical protein BHM03_00005058 [Ensete ventricosum]|nr:hypothetical protein BHM03_00005058 [Ensete ventricosum]